MNLLPFETYLKFRHKPDQAQIDAHDQRVVDAVIPIASKVFAHATYLAPDQKGKVALEYANVLASVVRHVDVSKPERAATLVACLSDGLRSIKSSDFQNVPAPMELAVASSQMLFIPGGQQVARVIAEDIWRRNSFDSIGQAENSLEGAISQGEAYLSWLRHGMPDKDEDIRDPVPGTEHPCSLTYWHHRVYLKITPEEIAMIREVDGGPHLTDDYESIAWLKGAFVTRYLEYIAQAKTCLSIRISAMNAAKERKRR